MKNKIIESLFFYVIINIIFWAVLGFLSHWEQESIKNIKVELRDLQGF